MSEPTGFDEEHEFLLDPGERGHHESHFLLADLGPMLDESRRRRIAEEPRNLKITAYEIVDGKRVEIGEGMELNALKDAIDRATRRLLHTSQHNGCVIFIAVRPSHTFACPICRTDDPCNHRGGNN